MKIDSNATKPTQNITGLSQREATFLSLMAEKGQTVFRFVDTLEFWQGAPAARSALSRLQRGGWLQRIERGLYMLIPLDAGPSRMWSENALVIASYLMQPGAIAYWSALHYWNLTEQLPNTVFIQSTQRKSKTTMTIAGVRYRFITIQPLRFFGLVQQPLDQHVIQVTDREKTVVDAVDRPDLAGGIRQLVEVLQDHWQELNWTQIDIYLARFHSGAVIKRLGYLVDVLDLPIPERAQRLQRWRSQLGAGIVLLEPGSQPAGVTLRRWLIQDNLGLTVK